MNRACINTYTKGSRVNRTSCIRPFTNNFVQMKSLIIIISITIILVGCETNILGPNEGSVTGNITDIYGNPVDGATVKITYFEINKDGNQTEKSITRASDTDGTYYADVPLAEIGILISKNGYKDVIFYDYLEQDQSTRSFSTVLHGNPTGSDLRVLNNPYHIMEIDTVYIGVNITDEYKFKKQEPYFISLILVEAETIQKRSYTVEVPFFSSSFKVVNSKIKMRFVENGDTVKPGSYKLNAIIFDSDGLESSPIVTDLIVN